MMRNWILMAVILALPTYVQAQVQSGAPRSGVQSGSSGGEPLSGIQSDARGGGAQVIGPLGPVPPSGAPGVPLNGAPVVPLNGAPAVPLDGAPAFPQDQR